MIMLNGLTVWIRSSRPRRLAFDLLLIAAIVALPQRMTASDEARPAISGKVTDETEKPIAGAHVRVGFEHRLTKGHDIDAVVFTPDGHPAVRAKVAVAIPAAGITIVDGDIDDRATYAARRETDEEGHFRLPPQANAFRLIIAHPAGYAVFRPIPRSNHRMIQLDPWTRVEGTYRVNGRPLADVALLLVHPDLAIYLEDQREIFHIERITTGPEGRFVFERVTAGWGAIGRHSNLKPSFLPDLNLTYSMPVTLHVGKTIHIEMNENGRPIIGRLRPPQGFKEEPPWKFASVEVEMNHSAELPKRHWTFPVNGDGSFRTGYLPSGVYRVACHVGKHGMGHHAAQTVSISTAENEHPNTPVDLGVLTLEKD